MSLCCALQGHASRVRLMEGLVESIGESALGKLAELTVRFSKDLYSMLMSDFHRMRGATAGERQAIRGHDVGAEALCTSPNHVLQGCHSVKLLEKMYGVCN